MIKDPLISLICSKINKFENNLTNKQIIYYFIFFFSDKLLLYEIFK